jgi:TDG/mug DNA glycosylase family protein
MAGVEPPAPGLGDLLAPGLEIVFVGYNPSLPAWRTGHYYANPGNQFYRLLHACGLTPHRLSPEEDATLLRYGIGLTDLLAGSPSARAADLPADAYRQAAPALWQTLAAVAPPVICFNGRGVFALACGRLPRGDGVQPERPPVGASVIAVVPSSSGLANRWAADRLAAYEAVAALVGRGPRVGAAGTALAPQFVTGPARETTHAAGR